MKQVKVRRMNGKIYPSDYVGIINVVDGIQIKIINYDSTYDELSIEIDGYGNGLYRSEEKISMAFGEDIFIDKLKTYYEIETIVDDGVDWSADTINAFDNLIRIGCTSFTFSQQSQRIDDDGEVENIPDDATIYATNSSGDFSLPCNFLNYDERLFLKKQILKRRKYDIGELPNSIKISSFIK